MQHRITYIILLLTLSFLQHGFGQEGYEIKIKLDGFSNDTLLLGYQYADKQYIKDTVFRTDDQFTFKGEEPLDCGMYLIIMPPENRYFQVLVNDQDQHFSLSTIATDPVENISIKGSDENDLFYTYLQYIGKQSPKAQKLNTKINELKEAKQETKKVSADLDKLNKEVLDYQLNIIDKHPQSLTARIVRTSREIEVPEFDMSSDEGKRARFRYLQEHWFDNADLSDPCLIRTSLIHKKVMTYLEKLTPQHPDSLNKAIDFILDLAKNNEVTKQHWLSTLLNKYANSKVIGLDAIYVHLIMNYYAKGEAPWVEEEKLIELVDNAMKTEPLLIGKIAPEIELPLLDYEATVEKAKTEEDVHKKFVLGEKVSLHKLDSPYKILFIWAPDCGHCKKSMPKMIEFYDKFKDKGVKLFAICHQNYKDTPDCADFIIERPGMMSWINVTDPYFRSRYQTLYNVKSTPQLYILDSNNEILMKRIGTDQLEEVMNELFKREEKK